ncbi:hypothetical protein IGI04_010134 [Brassica rapa subsp. trilocularis]|uniref:Uncharacterized protein n=1 Tax=Brassica rapa subsp. trilocularis TaxID=1813537 RepID=A0ABQ7MZC5_BRACM|nr:hypothetical protein IGI04_010134 [Brassica rapa subsp. trilocularis]
MAYKQNNAERLAGVAPGSRSRADFWCLRARGRERLWCVAPTGRSGSGATLVGRSERRERPRGVALGGRSERGVRCERLRGVAPGGRSGLVGHSDFVMSLREVAPMLGSSNGHLFTSFELQITSCGTPQNNAERLAGVAPGSRSRADFWCLRARGRERLWCVAVAPTGRSGSGATLVGRSERSLQGFASKSSRIMRRERPRGVALGGRSERGVRCERLRFQEGRSEKWDTATS